MIRRFEYAAILLVFAAGAAMADGDDPPARVGRLNYLNGPVSFRPASVEEWTSASLNYPLTTGDHLWADEGGQTEIHIGSTAVRMGSQTAMSFLNLDDRIVQISLTQGEMNVHIRFLGENESFEVDTPNGSVSLLRSGDYRINADGDNAVTAINVRGGEAEVTAGGSAFPVRSGQRARLAGMDNPQQEVMAVPPPDGFDRWCETRERREATAVSARYVPREMVGYEDLDEYGMWVDVPPYGMVWRPRAVVAGWAPYHYGRWAWVEPWGWTWIDEAPWGFAPFHYGRWAFAGGGWFWVPGRMAVVGVAVVRPVYAPALVAFVGGGGFHVAVGVGGGVGVAAWFPLGPGEVYRPAYHVSPTYVTNINVVHVTNVTVINNVNVTNVRYANQTVVGAVTVVPHEAFVSARPVAAASVRVSATEIAQARVTGTTAMVAPQRTSVLAASASVTVRQPPARFQERQVVAKTPPPAPPVPFAAKQQALAANGGRPLAPAELNTIRASAPPPRQPMVRSAAPGNNVQPANNQPGRTFGQPGTNQPGRTFGQPGNNPPASNQPSNQPASNPPARPMVNDRPMNARPQAPVNNGTNPAPPAQQTARPAVNEPRPAANERPAATTTNNNEQHGERKNDRPAKKAPPKKGENTEKKG
jgi:hypothetical protein